MRFSIRWALILGFLSLIWGTFLITATSMYVSSEEVLKQHALDIMKNIADLAKEQAQNHLAHAQAAAALTRRLLKANVVGIDGNNTDKLERYFLDQLTIYPHFAGIYLGKPNGDFYYVSRNDHQPGASFRTKIILNGNGRRSTRLLWRDADLNLVTDMHDPHDDFDPRVRPWYKRADADRQIVWTDPYIFFTSQKPGITIAGPTYKATGELRGIIGVDLDIDQLSTFIGNLKIGKHGRAFMVNNNGDLVAFPNLEKIRKTGDAEARGFRLVKIQELDDVLSREAFTAMRLQTEADGRYHLSQSRFARFEHDGRFYSAMLTPFSFARWPWMIGVHLPEDDYLGDLKQNRRDTILLTLAISGIATLIALLLARSIIRPIANLEQAALAMKNDDMTSDFDLRSHFKEICETATAFRRMKNTVRRSQEKYREIFENIQDVYYETDLSGTLLEISPSIESFTGYKRKELIGKDVSQFYVDKNSRKRLIEDLLQDKGISDYEIVLKDDRDESVYISLNSVLKTDDQGRPQKIIGSMRNITTRKNNETELQNYRLHLEDLVKARTAELERVNAELRSEIENRIMAQDALKQEEEKYRNILEGMEEGYFETDLRGNLTFCNNATANILGWSRSELAGKSFRRFVQPLTARRLLRIFADIHRTGIHRSTIGLEITRKDGSHRFIEISAQLIRGVEGSPSGYRGIGRDVTARLQAEMERRRLAEHLQQTQRLEALGKLAGGIAHDFNNLLMGIQGNASLMLIALEVTHPFYENIRSIERCVQSGANLTRQLLGYARGGKYMVKPTCPNEIVQKTTDLFERTKKEIRIVQDYQEGVWIVSVDRNQIEQVLVNLYLNAWQAMKPGGTLYLKTENVNLDQEFNRPFNLKPGRYVKIVVRDTGCGMTPEVQERVFEPFFTTKPMGGGTGLGLASAFGIVKNHAGIIDFTSQPGKGTTFFIYLPATNQTVDSGTEALEGLQKGDETILVVDDEEYILKACRAMLTDLGYAVLTAGSGEEATAILRELGDQIDLVILDMIMPEMDGRETFRRLKQLKPAIKILISSGYGLEEIADDKLDAAFDDFIQKPYDMYQASKMIRKVLDGNSTAAS
jgi:two-component system, cell cycle sensor histidine kinase and response regulator CckA